VEGEGDVFDGLFEAVVGEVGFSQVVVGDDQPEVGFAVVEGK
jgi:hypothetical protein